MPTRKRRLPLESIEMSSSSRSLLHLRTCHHLATRTRTYPFRCAEDSPWASSLPRCDHSGEMQWRRGNDQRDSETKMSVESWVGECYEAGLILHRWNSLTSEGSHQLQRQGETHQSEDHLGMYPCLTIGARLTLQSTRRIRAQRLCLPVQSFCPPSFHCVRQHLFAGRYEAFSGVAGLGTTIPVIALTHSDELLLPTAVQYYCTTEY
jgi:hypothetical protein